MKSLHLKVFFMCERCLVLQLFMTIRLSSDALEVSSHIMAYSSKHTYMMKNEKGN